MKLLLRLLREFPLTRFHAASSKLTVMQAEREIPLNAALREITPITNLLNNFNFFSIFFNLYISIHYFSLQEVTIKVKIEKEILSNLMKNLMKLISILIVTEDKTYKS